MKKDDDIYRLPPSGWGYMHMPDERRESLSKHINFDALVLDALAVVQLSGLTVRETCDECKREHGRRATRIGFELHSMRNETADAMDRLLNGAFGLRARYAIDPDSGSRATQILCEAILDAIAVGRWPMPPNDARETEHFVARLQRSLCMPSAKVWFGRDVDRSSAEHEPAKVLCERWERSRIQPAEIEAQIAADDFLPDAQFVEGRLNKGRTVPGATSLEVKAAFVLPSDEEYVPLNKRTRSLQIHLMGWS